MIDLSPLVRKELLAEDLWRPDWTKSANRSSQALWLDKNENPDPILNNIIMEIYRSVDAEAIYGYPDLSDLYVKLAEFIGVSTTNLLLSHGSDGVIRSMFEAFISVGDKILITSPTFIMYEIYGKLYGADVYKVEYSASPKGPVLEINTLVNAIKRYRPKLLCLPNPDSPTGTVFYESDLESIISTCADNNVLVLIDEAYHPFCQVTALPWIEKYSNLVIARTFAKAWGLAGLRIGYAVGGKDIIHYLHKVRPMYEINSVAASVVASMLDHEDKVMDSVERLKKGMNRFLDEMRGMGFGVVEGAGNFAHVMFGDELEMIDKKLNDKILYKKHFDHPSLAGCSRFSYATQTQIDKILELIKCRK